MTLLVSSILFFLWFFCQYFSIGARQRGCIYSESESGFWDVSLLISTKHGQISNQEDFSLHSYNVFPHHSSNYWPPGKTCSQAEALEGILRRGFSWVLQSKHHVSSPCLSGPEVLSFGERIQQEWLQIVVLAKPEANRAMSWSEKIMIYFRFFKVFSSILWYRLYYR